MSRNRHDPYMVHSHSSGFQLVLFICLPESLLSSVCLLCRQFSLSSGSAVDKLSFKPSSCLQLIWELKENVKDIYSASVFTVYLRGRNVADTKSLQLTKHTFTLGTSGHFPHGETHSLETESGRRGVLTRSERGRKWAERREERNRIWGCTWRRQRINYWEKVCCHC